MSFEIGFYKDVITPPIGIHLAGYAHRTHGSVGIHDHLYSRSLYIGYNDRKIFIVSLDLLGVTEYIRKKVVSIVKKQIDIQEENIVLSATHTHSGPVLKGYFENYLKEYLEILPQKIAGTIIASYQNRKKVSEFSYSEGSVEEVIINRRAPLKGPIDPRVHLINFKTDSQNIVFLNYTSHAVVLGANNYLISADYPGSFIKWYERITGYIATFHNGACANINPYTPGTDINRVYDRNVGTFDDVDWMGSILAFEAAKKTRLSYYTKIEQMKYLSEKIKLRRIDIPSLEELEKRYEEAKKKLNEEETLENRWNYYMARNSYLLAKKLSRRRYITSSISALSLNDNIAIVFLPSEVFVEHQLYIKKKSPFQYTIVVGYTNDYIGYIPTRKAYEEGGYETMFPVTLLAKGSGEQLRRYALKLLNKLR